MYIVIRDFTDLDDNRRLYEKSHTYPRKGYEPSEKRIHALSSGENKKGKVYIEKVADSDENAGKEEFPMHKGGGHYLLSNGESVKGKDEAFAAEEKSKSGE